MVRIVVSVALLTVAAASALTPRHALRKAQIMPAQALQTQFLSHKSELPRTEPPTSSLRMKQQGTSSSLQSSLLTRRTAFALGAALPFATARPSRAVIAGYDTTLSEAHQTGAVALWIDLTGCDVCPPRRAGCV